MSRRDWPAAPAAGPARPPSESQQMSQVLLRLRPLDDRSLPSVTFVEAGGVLTVRGDQWANTVVVSDDGTAGPGAVTVQADGQTYTSLDVVTRIRVMGWNSA